MTPLSPTLALLAALWSAPATPAPCEARAERVVRRAERRPMPRRATVILSALRRDGALGCGAVPAAHWREAPRAPERCASAPVEACAFEDGLELSPALARDADPALYLRVRLAAERLAQAGLLGPAHRRLFETLLLSSALARGR